jgi:hypothetical protein
MTQEITTFLSEYPGMTVSPVKGGAITLSGSFSYAATPSDLPRITDTYRVKIHVLSDFPQSMPEVYELDGKIPRDGNHHVNSDDTLCLGPPLRLRWKLNQNPTIVGFAEECLVPYFYSISHKLNYGTFPFGELDHGESGVIADYKELLRLPSEAQIKYALNLLGIKKRHANKQPCPCKCGTRLGACRYHLHHVKLRKLAERSWFRKHLATLGSSK